MKEEELRMSPRLLNAAGGGAHAGGEGASNSADSESKG